MPLTDDLPTLRRAVARLAIIEPHLHQSGNGRVAGTYLNVGMAWALRTLSPLWRGVWGVRDGRGLDRPGVSCAPGDSATECDVSLVKSILIVSDGANAPGEFIRTRLARRPDPQLNAAWSDRLCNPAAPGATRTITPQPRWTRPRHSTPASDNPTPTMTGSIRLAGSTMGDANDLRTPCWRWPAPPAIRIGGRRC